ncbi:uncharacterized protein LOC122311957 isoform X2 [Carya illinoinensis]|nr:uncharacterized protein LOC122311957 isoform X2 [Carya illinoinensis]
MSSGDSGTHPKVQFPSFASIVFINEIRTPFPCFLCSISSYQGFDSRCWGREIKMGFIMEFAENLVLRLMEDPKERDRKFREHVYAVKDRCNKTKEMWSYPLRPYGFWTFDRHNSQLKWDAQISQVPGRRDPYDDLLQHSHDTPK